MPKMHMTEDGPKKCDAESPKTCRAKFNGATPEHFSNEAQAWEAYQTMKDEEFAKKNPDALRKGKSLHSDEQPVYVRPKTADAFPQRFVHTNFSEMSKVTALLASNDKPMDVDEIKKGNDFKGSTGGFLVNTAGALGLVKREKVGGRFQYSLTDLGREYETLSKGDKSTLLKDAIKQSPAYKDWHSMKESDFVAKYSAQSGEDSSSATADRLRAAMDSLNEQVDNGIDWENARAKNAYNRDWAAGKEEKVLHGNQCPKCHMTMSLTGVCDNCD